MVLFYLRKQDGQATVNELSRWIAATENDVSEDELTSQQRKRVYVSLYQTHLPKLAETGMVDYDEDAGEVQLAERGIEMDAYLTKSVTTGYPWHLHYLLLALASVVLVGAHLLEVPGLGAIPVSVTAALITVALVGSTVLHYREYRKDRDLIPDELRQGDD